MEKILMHRWDVMPEEAVAIQMRLKSQVVVADVLGDVRVIVGIDNAYRADLETTYAAAVAVRYPELTVIEERTVAVPTTFPYVPGLLSFREGPAILAVLEQLQVTPDLLMLDGQGIAHPRGLGLASHIGVLLDLPAIGCAKSRLFGSGAEPGLQPGDMAPLLDHGKRIGTMLRTKLRTQPLYVSPGHRVSVETAARLVLACVRGYRLPEPTRLAHNLVSKTRGVTGEEPMIVPVQGRLFD